jgi:hypothetical protein
VLVRSNDEVGDRWPASGREHPVLHDWADKMLVHVFRGPGRVFGVTEDKAGANLPAQFAPWVYFKSAELDRERAMPGIDSQECIDDIAGHGFHITDAHMRITDRVIRKR